MTTGKLQANSNAISAITVSQLEGITDIVLLKFSTLCEDKTTQVLDKHYIMYRIVVVCMKQLV